MQLLTRADLLLGWHGHEEREHRAAGADVRQLRARHHIRDRLHYPHRTHAEVDDVREVDAQGRQYLVPNDLQAIRVDVRERDLRRWNEHAGNLRNRLDTQQKQLSTNSSHCKLTRTQPTRTHALHFETAAGCRRMPWWLGSLG